MRLSYASSSRLQASTFGIRPRIARTSPQICRRCISTANPSESIRSWSTPLARQLAEAITTTGPIPLASYMRQCLTSPSGGYYTSQRREGDQFGQKGDFVTSPEISQIFGELVGLWFLSEWISQGKQSKGVELIEVGPGRGTLMDDMLRTIRNFKSLSSIIEAVYLVEASPGLREKQKRLLCGETPMQEIESGYRCTSKYFDVPIVWYDDIRYVPQGHGKTPFIVAHEFFDALPIHAFQSVESTASQLVATPAGRPLTGKIHQWREFLVSPTSSSLTYGPSKAKGDSPEFQLLLSKVATRHSLLLPETSKRYEALKSQSGSVIEVCPEGQSYAAKFAQRIAASADSPGPKTSVSGAALILDYGPSATVPVNSFRGIKSHRVVSPFSSPGLVDLSADVDFTALAEAALKASTSVEVYGPVEQTQFLHTMGIKERAEQLLKSTDSEDEQKRKRVDDGWKRLVERSGGSMGRLYKAMAIVPNSDGRRRPVGFGGDVV